MADCPEVVEFVRGGDVDCAHERLRVSEVPLNQIEKRKFVE